MANRIAIECVDKLLKSLKQSNLPFGGMPFIGIGDFRQTAPIVRGTTADSIIFENSIKSSDLWKYFRLYQLREPVRMADDPEYDLWVEQIGNGTIGNAYDNSNFSKVNLHGMLDQIASIEEAFGFLFGAADIDNPSSCLCNSSFLSPLNASVNAFNSLVISKMSTQEGKPIIINIVIKNC
jgi:PIF1-like helicase